MRQKLNLFWLFLILFIGHVNYVKGATTYLSNGILYVRGSGEYSTPSTSASWYSNRNSITKIVVESGVTNIGSSAFSGCSKVTEATLNNKGNIGKYAFQNCTALKNVTINNSYNGTLIREGAFENCTALTNFTLNNTAQVYVYHDTFTGCTALTTVTLNNVQTDNPGIIYIDDEAFMTCTGLTRVNIGGKGNVSFGFQGDTGVRPFKGCSKLSVVNIEDLLSFLNTSAGMLLLSDGKYGTAEEKTLMIKGSTFSSTSELVIPEKVYASHGRFFRSFKNVTKIKLPSTIKTIPDNDFAGNKYLKEITLPTTLTSIGSNAFQDCTALTTVTLNNTGTININGGAFQGCTALTRLNMGKGSTVLKDAPFSGCSKLSVVNVPDITTYLTKLTGINYLTDGTTYGTAKEKTLMVNGVTHSSSSVLVIPEGIKSITNSAFRSFSNVKKIQIPSTIGEIYSSTFYGWKYLTDVTLNNKGNIGKYAFQNCTALKNVTINNSYNGTLIREGAFENCTALTNFTLNNTAQVYVYHDTFTGCTALTTVTLNNVQTDNPGIIYIDDEAFMTCTGLTRVNIGGKGNVSFGFQGDTGVRPFKGCSKLSVVNIEDLLSFLNTSAGMLLLSDGKYGTAEEKTLMIKGSTFSSTSELVIPEKVYASHGRFFRSFKNVTKIKLPSTIKTIPDNDFAGNKYLKEITLPTTLTSVGSGSFSNCPNLERIVCPALTPPSATNSIVDNPSNVTLKVMYGYYSVYKSASVWKNFNIINGNYYKQNTSYLKVLASKNLNQSISSSLKAFSWTTSNSSVATVSNGVVTALNYVYSGTTADPYKGVSIRAKLDNADVYDFPITVTPREAALTDGNVYRNTRDFNAEKITYTRTYAEKYANHLQCFYIPFDVEVTDELLEDYTFYKLYMISQKDENGNGEIEDNEPLVMLLNKIPAGQVMHANMPYYIKPKAASTLTVTAKNTTLYAAENVTVSCSTMQKEYSLTGVYEPTNIKGYYTMSAKGNFSYYTQDTNLGSYRWYMSVRDRMARGEEHEDYARPIEILVDGEDETTGIVALEDKASAQKNDKIYTLDGRQVTDFETLPSGIYIVNGKKMYKK